MMGRAARNINGRVILYADTITRSIKEATDEVKRRREIQEKYNEEHNIVPKSAGSKKGKEVIKLTDESTYNVEIDKEEIEKILQKSPKEISLYVEKLRKEMFEEAKQQNFSEAILLRDKILMIEKGLIEKEK